MAEDCSIKEAIEQGQYLVCKIMSLFCATNHSSRIELTAAISYQQDLDIDHHQEYDTSEERLIDNINRGFAVSSRSNRQ